MFCSEVVVLWSGSMQPIHSPEGLRQCSLMRHTGNKPADLFGRNVQCEFILFLPDLYSTCSTQKKNYLVVFTSSGTRPTCFRSALYLTCVAVVCSNPSIFVGIGPFRRGTLRHREVVWPGQGATRRSPRRLEGNKHILKKCPLRDVFGVRNAPPDPPQSPGPTITVQRHRKRIRGPVIF